MKLSFVRLFYFSMVLFAVLSFLPPNNAIASETPLSERPLWRFEMDNDAFGGSDDLFSSGLFLQRHTPACRSWDDVHQWAMGRWIVKNIPGLDDGEGLWSKRGIGFGHLIQTPDDIETSEFIPEDVPYAATLGVASTWYTFNDDRLAAFQFYVGMIGPAAAGREVQKFAHNDMGWGEDPLGWRHQLDNEPLININYRYDYKLARFGNWGGPRGFRGDLSVSGQAALGNYFTLADVMFNFRCGWQLPRGFAHIPDVIGRGVITDPTPDVPTDVWRGYFSLATRGTAIAYSVLFDGNTFEDSHSIDYDNYVGNLIIGLHFGKGAFSMHYNLYLATTPTDTEKSDLTWGNVTMEYRF
jgi:lipid A 3-O-deacylase